MELLLTINTANYNFSSMRLSHALTILCVGWLSLVNAQSIGPEIPKEYQWDTPQEYAVDEASVTEVLKWLCSEPLGLNIQKRSLANAYVMEWITGSPSIRLEVNSEVFPFLEEHPELLFSLIQGMAFYSLGHPDEKDAVKLHAEGLETVAHHAELSEELSKDGDLKKLIKANRKRQLKVYYQESLEDWEKAKQNN